MELAPDKSTWNSMTQLRKMLCCFVASAALGSATLAYCQGLDRIQRRNGTDGGKITALTPLRVTITNGGVATDIAVEDIQSIRFAGEPSELNAARLDAAKSRYREALDELEKISPADIKRSEVKQDFDFLYAFCSAQLALAGVGDLERATNEVTSFLSKHRQSYHLSAAIELLGDLLLSAGDVERARNQYAKLGNAPAPYFKARSAVLIGRLLQSQQQHEEALAEFDKAIDLAAGNTAAASQRQEATLLAAVSRSAIGAADATIDAAKEVIRQANEEDVDLLARAYNALGNCYLNLSDKHAARNAFLHVDLLFASVANEHARALYELSQLWQELGQKQRAADARQRLQDDYPASPWTRRL